METVIKEKMFKEGQIWCCSDCSYQSKQKSHVYEHVEAKHVEHSGYACSFCNKVFKRKGDFGRHKSHCTNSANVQYWMRLLLANERSWIINISLKLFFIFKIYGF